MTRPTETDADAALVGAAAAAIAIIGDAFVGDEVVCAVFGISRTTLWRERRAGRLPMAVRVSPGRTGTRVSRIREELRLRSINFLESAGGASGAPSPHLPQSSEQGRHK